MKKKQNKAIITCPYCGHYQTETMPDDSCQFFLKCDKCKRTMTPKVGDCCVFCSYADSQCPVKQIELSK